MIIISSNYHITMAKELRKINITVIDIYEYLKRWDFPKGKTLSDILYGKRLIY